MSCPLFAACSSAASAFSASTVPFDCKNRSSDSSGSSQERCSGAPRRKLICNIRPLSSSSWRLPDPEVSASSAYNRAGDSSARSPDSGTTSCSGAGGGGGGAFAVTGGGLGAAGGPFAITGGPFATPGAVFVGGAIAAGAPSGAGEESEGAPGVPPIPNASAIALLMRGPAGAGAAACRSILRAGTRSEEHTSELQSRRDLVCRLLLEKKKERKNLPSSKSIYTTRYNFTTT